jgi:hypothetical protein
MAFVGGRLPIEQWVFTGLLGLSLLVAGALLIARSPRERPLTEPPLRPCNVLLHAGLGGGIGLLAGIVGIGGGIFLAPIMHLMNWNSARAIAGACSVFIMTNSIAGLGGQLLKLQHVEMLNVLGVYVWVFPAVLAGGLLGNRITRQYLSPIWIRRVTGVLIFYVAVRLLVMTPGIIADG